MRNSDLEVRAWGDEFGLHAAASPHRWGRVRTGTRKSLDYLSFGAFVDDLAVFRERVRKRGIGTSPPPHALDDGGLWLRDDDGTLIEIREAEKVSPNGKSDSTTTSSAAGTAGHHCPRMRPSCGRGASRTCSSSQAMSRAR
jgi:hypothetical protein